MAREKSDLFGSSSSSSIRNGFDDSMNRSKEADSNYKTELCKTWIEKFFCPYGEKCRFAHGKKDLIEKSTNSKNFKRKEGNSFYKKGFCPYGPRCHFKHEERRLHDINLPYYTYLLNSPRLIKKFNKINCEVENCISNDTDTYWKCEESKNLPVFKNIHCNNFSLENFRNDLKNNRNVLLCRKFRDLCM